MTPSCRRRYVFFLFFSLFAVKTVWSQDGGEAADLQFQWSTAVQVRYSYASSDRDSTEHAGFGLRRARLRGVMTYRQKLGIQVVADFSSGNASVVDFFAFYWLGPTVRLRAGYLVGAQPRGYGLTSSSVTDGVERGAIGERWARGGIGSAARDFGVDVLYDDGHTRLMAFLHNGDGSFATLRSNFREGITGLSPTGGVDRRGMAISGFADYKLDAIKGLELGGFAGYNGSRNPNTAVEDDGPGRTFTSFSAHVYWGATPGSQPVRLKGEVIGMRYASSRRAPQQRSFGYAVTAAVRLIEGAELAGGIERFAADSDLAADTYTLVSLNLSSSARRGLPFNRERLTLAYMHGAPAGRGGSEHLAVLQFQLAL
ncbi:MAG: hypothetical protein SH809_18855 [Rhodothermales bacterium]|nr:hypothetical protein [Rhodothermales bacterium]